MPEAPHLGSYDLAVIGGGITGAGIARDAALRGLSCILLEQGDFASGTSSRTTRLVHGGLRYLEHGQFQLVFESLRERDVLLEMAPHLIHPIPILLPVFQDGKRSLWKIRAGLKLYDVLSLGKGTPHHGVLKAREALRKAPFLPTSELVGAGLFYDYQIPLPERLVFENLFSARDHGARCLNYHRVERIRDIDDAFDLEVTDLGQNTPTTCRARVVVNATGPWADLTGERYRSGLAQKVEPTKGTHIVVDADLDHAVFSDNTPDGRLVFTLPLEGMTLVGTTDTRWEGDPATAVPTPDDVAYLLDALQRLHPGRAFTTDDILWGYAGIRPLAHQPGSKAPSDLARSHVLHREGAGHRFFTMVGGKYTTFRKMAEETVDAVCRTLEYDTATTTEHAPLFGGGLGDRTVFRENLCECTGRIPDLHRNLVDRLVSLYGRKCCEVMELGLKDPTLIAPLAPGYPDCRMQVVHAARWEDARHLDDVILRRLHMGLSPDRGLSGAEAVAGVMGEELGWDAGRRTEELERFKALVAAEMPCLSESG